MVCEYDQKCQRVLWLDCETITEEGVKTVNAMYVWQFHYNDRIQAKDD